MKISDVSIARPVFTTMVIGALVVFGLLLYTRLNVDLYPEVDFPIVTVTVVYPGASPETMEEQVADPIEEAVNSLSGIRSLRSTSVEGVAQVYVEFELGVDLDVGAQDVRDRVATVVPDLPDGAEAPSVEKLDLGAAPIMQLSVAGDDQRALADYVEDRLKPDLERIGGVGQVRLIGLQEREVQVYVDLGALQGYRLTVQDLVMALGRQNIEIPAGNFGSGRQNMVLRTDARFASVEELGRTTIATVQGIPVSLAEVATIEDSFEERASITRLDGRPAVAVQLIKQSDANTVAVAREVHERMAELNATAPAGITIQMVQDNSTTIVASIETVQLDLVLGALLAIAIIFIFLRDLARHADQRARAAHLGHRHVRVREGHGLHAQHDDHARALALDRHPDRRRHRGHREHRAAPQRAQARPPWRRRMRGTAEIGLAVLATTLSIVAVFVPVAFMEGMFGPVFL
jgi:HAE1 family hydrophobic/amphiphilic exporter-1